MNLTPLYTVDGHEVVEIYPDRSECPPDGTHFPIFQKISGRSVGQMKFQVAAYGICDDSPPDPITRYRWSIRYQKSGSPSILRSENRNNITLARVLLNLSPGDPQRVVYLNGNPYDHRLSNLTTTATLKRGGSASGVQRNTKTGIKGVGWDARDQKYRPCIRINGPSVDLGTFEDKTHGWFTYNYVSHLFYPHLDHLLTPIPPELLPDPSTQAFLIASVRHRLEAKNIIPGPGNQDPSDPFRNRGKFQHPTGQTDRPDYIRLPYHRRKDTDRARHTQENQATRRRNS